MAGVDIMQAAPVGQELTDEQEAILAEPPERTIVVEAAAGAGKTSTLVAYSRKWRRFRGLYLSFNRDIAEEARQRFPAHIKVKTAHGYAFNALGVSRYKDRLAGRIKRNDIKLAGMDLRSDFLPPDRMMRAVLNGITNFCIDAGNEFLPRHCGLERSPPMVQEVALKQIAAVVKRFLGYETSGLPFTHDMYLKRLEMQGSIGAEVDYLLVDESQDLNPVLVSLIKKSGRPSIIVGDPKQSIYGFRGAINAFDSFDGPRFPLSQSWRFGEDVAVLSNHILSFSEKAPLHAVRGRPDRETTIELYDGKAPSKAFILARTNSRLFEGLVKIQVPFYVAGGFDVLASQLLSAWALFRNDQWNVTDGYVRSFNTWDEFAEEGAEHDPDARRLAKIVTDYGAQIPGIIDRLRGLQRPNHQDAHIMLSTAHKAKGLEADTVVICDDFETPAEMRARLLAEKIDQLSFEQEINLLYVACSRPRYRLLLPPSLYEVAQEALIVHQDKQKGELPCAPR